MTGWFRVWEDMADDPKWGAIGKAARVPPGLVLGLAIKLLTRASTNDERGSIAGYNADALAYGLGCKAEKIEAMIAGMRTIGLIVDDRFVAWDKRQPKREDNSAERVRAHRERAKSAASEAVTPCNAPEAEADTDQKAAAAAPARAAEPTPSGIAIGSAAAAAGSVDLEERRDRGQRSAVREAAVRLHSWVCELTRAPNGWRHELGIVEGWLSGGFDAAAEVKPAIEAVLARQNGQLPTSLRYFEGAIADQRRHRGRTVGQGAKAPSAAAKIIDWRTANDEQWRTKLGVWARQRARYGPEQTSWPEFARWRAQDPMGPPPGDPGCRAPTALVDEAIAATEAVPLAPGRKR